MIRFSKFQLFSASLLASLLVLAGCGRPAGYIDPEGPQTVVTLDSINIQDWANAADTLTTSLINSGVLQQAQHSPANMAISTIVNGTTEHIDTDWLTGRIRSSLNRSGLVRTSTTIGAGGRVQDPLARQMQEAERAATGETRPQIRDLDFTLSGKILEDQVRAGRVRQTTYLFQLALSDKSGFAIWEDEVRLTKQGTRPGVGW